VDDLSDSTLRAALAFIRADASEGRLAHWAHSTVLDELVGRPVLPETLVAALHAAAGLETTFPLGHAGILHVYGYWFSTEPTPYGYKRDRWLDGRLATALGRPPGEFLLMSDALSSASDATRTPLQRVTETALPILLSPPSAALAVRDETVGALRARTVLLRVPQRGPAGLVYGVDAGEGLRLVTAFPVDDPAALLAEMDAGPARLRWNAVDPRGS
jgi:hypothetical protein